MSEIQDDLNAQVDETIHELQAMQKHWWCLALLGMALMICGVGALVYPFFASVGVAIALGVFLLISGIGTVIAAFWANDWGAFLLQLIIGILYCVLGLAMAESPLVTGAALTMLVAAFAIAGGAIRIVAALSLRFPQWGWVLVNGTISLIFGVVVFRHFPEASLLVLGVLLGVDFIFSGLTWLFLALDVRSLCVERVE